MKLSLLISLLVLSLNALAEKVEIPATDGADINISQIERSINVDNANGRINVVEIDNGGSTDIGSVIYPSELLITYYKDGEMVNVRGTFDLGPIHGLKGARMKDQFNIAIDVEIKDMQMKISSKKIIVDISDLVKNAINPEITVKEGEEQTIHAKVISSEKLGQ